MKFKDYEIKYCGLCESPIISCEFCGHGSCTGGGCDKCENDFKDFFQFEKDNQKMFDDFFAKDLQQAKIDKANNTLKELKMLEELGFR